MHLSNHTEIITVLTELYTLLDSLAVISHDLVRLPPTSTGVHPPSIFNATAAGAAGFSSETVAVLSALPYLDVGRHEMMLALQPSTYPLSYLGADLDEGYFSTWREMLETEEPMPSSAIQLTWEEGGYGMVYIYDTETSESRSQPNNNIIQHQLHQTNRTKELVTPWKHWGDPTDASDYFHVPSVSPREAFQPMIDNFRSLHYLGLPPSIDHNNSPYPEYGRNLPDWNDWDRPNYQAGYDVWEATRRLVDIYLDCGWDVDAVEQHRFRRAEFIARRERHLEDVVKPLQDKADGIESENSKWSRGLRGRTEL
jgi:hypothetical protein